MPEIHIPKEVVPGFNAIAALSKESIDIISQYLLSAQVSSSANYFLSNLESFLEENLKNTNVAEIVKTIASFVELSSEGDYETVSENLANSFKELYEGETASTLNIDLKNNLRQIIKSSNNLELSVKAHELMRENGNILSESKILSDIRIVFNKELSETKRKAVIIHNLHLKYSNSRSKKDFYVSLDLDHLKQLQKQIDRALEKEEIIKKDYKNLDII